METSNDAGLELLSKLIIYGKYSNYLPELGRREVWDEIVDRTEQMHLRRFPQIREQIEWAFGYVRDKKVLPSMRSLQFGGKAIEKNEIRCYNCAFLPIDSIEAFSETLYLLLCGTGVGYSVRIEDVEKLPCVVPSFSSAPPVKHIIGDSIEGWADATYCLVDSYIGTGRRLVFDYSRIREKGARLSSGGIAPGPEPLRIALEKVEAILKSVPVGSKLTPLNCHDILCHLSNAVLSGGIRRSAMISLFSKEDTEMLKCKFWDNLKDNFQRFRANNSVCLVRDETSKETFDDIWKMVRESNAGEPGIFWTNDTTGEYGTNPCCEISLRKFSFCNLVEINASSIEDETDLYNRVDAATLIATLQASYTNFKYLRPIWKQVTDEDALIGVSMTGIASSKVLDMDLTKASDLVKERNAYYADIIGINKAARTTTVKPAGTSSIVLKTSSGVHAWHSKYYIRRVVLNVNEPIAKYMMQYHPGLLVESQEKPGLEVIVEVPVQAPDNSRLRTETALEFLSRVKQLSLEWVLNGHNRGTNHNNVSATVNIRPNEWIDVGEWLWDNKDLYAGMSCLPYDDSVYVQAPFEEISEEEYYFRAKKLQDIDMTLIREDKDNTDLEGELACSGGSCEVRKL